MSSAAWRPGAAAEEAAGWAAALRLRHAPGGSSDHQPLARNGCPRRLSATDLVRREAERERDCLELAVQHLHAALAEAQAGAGAVGEDAAAQLARAQQALAVERQRGEALQVRGGGDCGGLRAGTPGA